MKKLGEDSCKIVAGEGINNETAPVLFSEPKEQVSKEELLLENMKPPPRRRPKRPRSDPEIWKKLGYSDIKIVRNSHHREGRGLCKAQLRTIFEEWAKEAVNCFNKQAKYEKMQLKHIKGALYRNMPILVYHINMDVNLLEEDGKEIPKVCQAVVVQETKDGPVEVFSFKFGSPDGEGTEGWCREGHACHCGLSIGCKKWSSKEEELKSECPGSYLSLDNELEAKKMKHSESPESVITHCFIVDTWGYSRVRSLAYLSSFRTHGAVPSPS